MNHFSGSPIRLRNFRCLLSHLRHGATPSDAIQDDYCHIAKFHLYIAFAVILDRDAGNELKINAVYNRGFIYGVNTPCVFLSGLYFVFCETIKAIFHTTRPNRRCHKSSTNNTVSDSLCLKPGAYRDTSLYGAAHTPGPK